VSGTLLLFLVAAIGAVVSAYFWVLARRDGDRPLMWATGVAVVLFCVAAYFFGVQL
jgi:hypothetical protein